MSRDRENLTEKRSVLIVDDEAGIVDLLKERLLFEGYEVNVADNGTDALRQAKIIMPDLILLDIMMSGLDGLEVKRHLNLEECTADIPVIFLSGRDSVEDKVTAFKLQASDYVTKPFVCSELLARVDSLSRRRKRYEQMFMTDSLTGLSNVHVFKKSFKWLFDIAKRYQRFFSIALLDLDKFKAINDMHGHSMGDAVLRRMAEVMKRNFRKEDILIRYGGDEFIVLMPETPFHQATVAINRLKQEIASGALTKETESGKEVVRFSFSAGVAEYMPSLDSEAELFELADRNMYGDKKSK